MADQMDADQGQKSPDSVADMELASMEEEPQEEPEPEEEEPEEEEDEEETDEPNFDAILQSMEACFPAPFVAPLGEHMGPVRAAYNDLYETMAAKMKDLEAEEADVEKQQGEMKARFGSFKENMRELLNMGPSQGGP